MKYTGPAKPSPTHVEMITDNRESVILLVLAIVAGVFLFRE